MPAKIGCPSNPIVLAGSVGYYPGCISAEEADELFAALLKLKWSQQIYRGAGPDSPLCAWMGDSSPSPRLAAQAAMVEWTPEAMRINLLAEELTGCAFDSLLLNLYRDHRDSVDLNSSGIGEAPQTFPIATVSLGAERRIRWENIKDGSTTTQLLEHGSLLLMPPGFQRENRHELPKQEKLCGPRISLAFSRKVAP